MYSDRTLKENINPLDDETADKVLKFTPVSFNLKQGTKLQFGFIAQDIEEILPNLVYKNERGVRSVAYNQIIPLLLHQIQVLTERVDELDTMFRNQYGLPRNSQ
jgi:hypothetical protein